MLDIKNYSANKDKTKIVPLGLGRIKIITETYSPQSGERLEDVESEFVISALVTQRQEIINQNEQYAKLYEENENLINQFDELIADAQSSINKNKTIPSIKRLK